MKRFSAFVIVFCLGCQADEPKQALDMGQDLGQDLGADLETRDMAAELLNCQSSWPPQEQTCVSPKDPSIFCCPISDESCDGRYIGGSSMNGHCGQEFDGYGTGFVGRDENGCFYVRAEGSCFEFFDMTQDMMPLVQDM